MDILVGTASPTTHTTENNMLDETRREAEMSALRTVQAKLEKPESLEKLEQLHATACQRKRVLDDQLRAAVQSQLESIQSGIEQIQASLTSMQKVEQTMREADDILQKIAPLQSKLEDLRHEANTYRQISLAQANLDYIIKTPENVKKADELMAQEKLLQAHQLIMEIENSRNYLLLELHRATETDSQAEDIQLVITYFSDYDRLVAHLRQLITFRISRWYDCAISAPEKLVTALRIIEREEQVDRLWIEKRETTGFSPSDRPRQWKKLCFDQLRKSVKDRIEGNQLETREEHKYWLTRHLEMCRKIFLRDFDIITRICQRCFPQRYEIVNRFLDYYHNCLKEHLTEICDPKRRPVGDTLTTAEVYTIVTFARDYLGPECLGDPRLKLDLSQLSPLLEREMLAAVTDVFINERKQKFSEWIPNIINAEVKDWYDLKEVEMTSDHYYATSMPRMLINMIIETLDMSKQMSDETCQMILSMVFGKVDEFRALYEQKVDGYSSDYFKDRQRFRGGFTKQMVANANNCESIPQVMLNVRQKYNQNYPDDLSSSSQQQLNRYERVEKSFNITARHCCNALIREMETDTIKFLRLFFTNEWFGRNTKPCCETVIETTRDYWSSELTHLKKPLLQYLFDMWHKRILAYYLRNLLNRSVSIKFERPTDRSDCSRKLRHEANMLANEFKSWDGTTPETGNEYHFQMLSNIADILEQTDFDSIVLEIATFAKRYPSLSMDQVTQILLLRGDLTKNEARQKADAALANMPRINQGVLFEIMEIVNQLDAK